MKIILKFQSLFLINLIGAKFNSRARHGCRRNALTTSQAIVLNIIIFFIIFFSKINCERSLGSLQRMSMGTVFSFSLSPQVTLCIFHSEERTNPPLILACNYCAGKKRHQELILPLVHYDRTDVFGVKLFEKWYTFSYTDLRKVLVEAKNFFVVVLN